MSYSIPVRTGEGSITIGPIPISYLNNYTTFGPSNTYVVTFEDSNNLKSTSSIGINNSLSVGSTYFNGATPATSVIQLFTTSVGGAYFQLQVAPNVNQVTIATNAMSLPFTKFGTAWSNGTNNPLIPSDPSLTNNIVTGGPQFVAPTASANALAQFILSGGNVGPTGPLPVGPANNVTPFSFQAFSSTPVVPATPIPAPTSRAIDFKKGHTWLWLIGSLILIILVVILVIWLLRKL